MNFVREINLATYKSSVLLMGPRMTGKTRLLSQQKYDLFIDLLDPEQELNYKSNPKQFYREVSALTPGSLVVVDEIQKIPTLLDYVQLGIEKLGLRFLLSGSSARKLKRHGANLLAGRALLLHLHPLSEHEFENKYSINQALQFGTLPKIADFLLQNQKEEAKQILRSYRQLYLHLEIQQEALTRNLGNFTRFLDVAAQYNAQQIVYQNIATSGQIPRSTVSGYFEILEDTLIGTRIWEYQKSEKDKHKPKFYFFDCGVVRAVQNRLDDPPTPAELGHLFETFIFLELRKIRDYQNKPHSFAYWNNGEEIDLLIQKNDEILLAIECKSGQIGPLRKYKNFQKKFPNTPIVIVSLINERPQKVSDTISILPWKDLLKMYRAL